MKYENPDTLEPFRLGHFNHYKSCHCLAIEVLVWPSDLVIET